MDGADRRLDSDLRGVRDLVFGEFAGGTALAATEGKKPAALAEREGMSEGTRSWLKYFVIPLLTGWCLLIPIRSVLVLTGCASSGEAAVPPVPEVWTFEKSGGISNDEHIVTVKGHGQVCYVFVEDMNGRNAAALLWCEKE